MPHPTSPSPDAPDPMDAIKETFFQECEEQLAELESGLLVMEAGGARSGMVDAVFRAVHSIKGGAGAFALESLVRFAHVFETSLDRLRSNRLAPEPAVLQVMLRAADVLADLVRAAQAGTALEPARADAVAAELDALDDGAAPPPDDGGLAEFSFAAIPAAGQRWVLGLRPHAAMYAGANDIAPLLRELSRLGPIQAALDSRNLPSLDGLDPGGAYLAWTVELLTSESEARIRDVFEFVDGDCELLLRPAEEAGIPAGEADVMELIRRATQDTAEQPAPPCVPTPADTPRADAHGAAKPTIRVDLDRVDRLVDLVGELVIHQAMLAQRVLEFGLTRASRVAVGLDELETLTRSIQEGVMAIRAQPVKSVFQRMPRLTREVAARTGKQVRLVTDGEATEVDRTVIEHLADPLTHMIRNAIDHGVERPEARRAAGKPAEGTVRLAALHRSGRIVIEVADDGAGIDRPRIRASAVAKGLVAPDAAMSDDEIDNLIFTPGFSTADTVSEVSGRGVGMDVVRRQVQSLGGRISITSRPGEGSCFTLSLPLTLAVLDGMVVQAAGHTLIVPLTAIVETLQPAGKDVHGFGGRKADGAARVVAIRGTCVPLIDVATSLGFRRLAGHDPRTVALLVENEAGRRAALLVDCIQGQRQVVIKSLEANYRQVPGVAAATILGDGRVALILDVDALTAGTASPPDLSAVPAPGSAGLAYA